MAGGQPGITAQPVGERHWRDSADMVRGHRVRAVECRERARCADRHQFAAQAIGAQRHADTRGLFDRGIGRFDGGQRLARAFDGAAQLAVLPLPLGDEAFGILLIGVAPLHNLDALGNGRWRRDRDGKAEAIEKLRAQFALFGIAAADQANARGMAYRQPVALDQVLAARRHIEQQVDQMILEEVHLVDIEETAIGAGEQAWLERLHALAQSAFEIERADQSILADTERQIDHRHGRFGRLLPTRFAALGATRGSGFGRAAIAAAFQHRHIGQELGERPLVVLNHVDDPLPAAVRPRVPFGFPRTNPPED